MLITQIQSTPNPDAIKLMLDEPQTLGIRSYRSSAPPPENDPLARSLLELPGVVGVLIHERFITLSREQGRDWKPLVRAAKLALADHAHSPSGSGSGSGSDHDNA